MVGQDQGAGLRYLQPRFGIDACGLKLIEFLDQGFRRQNDAVADVAGDASAQDARRYQMQHRLLAAYDQRMPGVVAALKAHYSLRMIGQPVDDLAFALVTPLGADNHYVLCHFNLP